MHLPGCAVHGEHIADVHHRRLIAEVLQVDVGQVEMDTLHQQVGGDEHFLIRIKEYGAVVADAVSRTLVFDLDVFGEMVDQTELSEFCYFHSSVG